MKKIITGLIFVFLTASFLLSYGDDSDSSNLVTDTDKDITLLIHENMFNDLFSKSGNVEQRIKKGKVRLSNLDFQFYDGQGQLSIDVKITGKKKILSIKKTVKIDMKLQYDFSENLIRLDVDKVKINFGKIIGDLDFTKLLSVESYEFSVPVMENKPMSINDKLITPTIVDAEAVFVEDAIKIAYKIEYQE